MLFYDKDGNLVTIIEESTENTENTERLATKGLDELCSTCLVIVNNIHNGASTV